MKLQFLGTGTSHGIPVIACNCKVCKSLSKKNKRNRCSVYVTTNDDKKILIDIGPEFRIQAIKYNVNKIDALLLTHSHADHLHGIDDLRIFSCAMFKKPDNARSMEQYNAPPIPVYTNKTTLEDLKNRFGYFFCPVKEGGGHAKVNLQSADSKFTFADIEITPIPMMHGHLQTVGWLLTETDKSGNKKSIAYLTDCSFISDESIDLIHKNCGTLQHLIIDGLRIKEHSTHFNYLQALETAEKIGGEKIWVTHITHSESHRQIIKYIKSNLKQFPGLLKAKSVLPAYDGLVIKTR